MARIIEITPAEAATARLLVKMAERRGETVPAATRAMANAVSRAPAQTPQIAPSSVEPAIQAMENAPPEEARSNSTGGTSAEIELSELASAVAAGDQAAWVTLVHRFSPLVTSIARRYRLTEQDAEDVNQTVWLRIIENIDRVREPRALPGWIAATTKNEVLRSIAATRRNEAQRRISEGEALYISEDEALSAEVESKIDETKRKSIRDALAELNPQHRELLLLLTSDPPRTYEQISRQLGLPLASIGPTRARALNKLRATTALDKLPGKSGPSSAPGVAS